MDLEYVVETILKKHINIEDTNQFLWKKTTAFKIINNKFATIVRRSADVGLLPT